MENTKRSTTDSASSWMLVGSFYLWGLSAVVVAITLYRSAAKPDVSSFLSSRAGWLGLLASLALVALPIAMIGFFYKYILSRARLVSLTLITHLIIIVILMTMGELAVRVFSEHTFGGTMLGDTILLPRYWADVKARSAELLMKASNQPPYLVQDELLGWVVGQNRQSEDGLYFSSVEGVRSPRPGIAVTDSPFSYRIALVGDSFTFGEEVSFEDSLGHQLELSLGPEFQILNFGVMGYGLDQMYLRYTRDVRPLHPDIVILGFVIPDLDRTMLVYPFLQFPHWKASVKPRFVWDGAQLSLLNVPLPPPQKIFSVGSIKDLPFIEYDPGYVRTHWDRPYWCFSYLLRWAISLVPPLEQESEQTSDKMMQILNRELFRSFVRLAREEGSVPIVVFFPIDRDPVPAPEGYLGSGALKILRDAGIQHVDVTSCVHQVSVSDRYVGRHYSAKGNAAAAGCLNDLVVQHLSK